jgi:hypothetical protein
MQCNAFMQCNAWQNWCYVRRRKSELIEFKFMFDFSPISKDERGGEHPKPHSIYVGIIFDISLIENH